MTIEQTLKKLTKEKADALTEEKLYKSIKFEHYIASLVSTILNEKMDRIPKLKLTFQTEDTTSAYTTGDSVVINCNSHSIKYFQNPQRRFVAFLGLLYHELSHILFSSFDDVCKAQSCILVDHKLYGEEPSELTEEQEKNLEEVKDALKHGFENTIAKLYADWANICADVHDEEHMIDMCGSGARNAIATVREHHRTSERLYEEEKTAVDMGRLTKLDHMHNILLHYLRFGDVYCRDDEVWNTSEYLQVLKRVVKHVVKARNTSNMYTRYSELNYLMIEVWPYLKERINDIRQALNNQGGGQGSSGSSSASTSNKSSPNSSGNSNSEIDKAIVDELLKGDNNRPMTKQSQFSGHSSELDKLKTSEAAGTEEMDVSSRMTAGMNSSEAEDTASDDDQFEQIIRTIAREEAEDELEEQQAEELSAAGVKAINACENHKHFPVSVKRILKTSASDIKIYEQEMKDLKVYSKQLQKQLRELLREPEDGDVNRHRAFGPIICAEDAYRPDRLFFANKKNTEDFPGMAISVLVDESGSMTLGVKMRQSMRAAMLLHDFATGLGLPVSVSGHTTSGDTIVYEVFTDFDQYSDKDKYRLAQMRPQDRNRDGAALEICADHLQSRPEKVKLLIIISDGQPNHTNYGSKEAEKDIKGIITRCRAKGIEIIAAAIDSDKDRIKAIYGDGYLDITDLKLFPRTMVNLVKTRLKSIL